jgi:hypothetical protein
MRAERGGGASQVAGGTWAGGERGFEPDGLREIPRFGPNAKEGREKSINQEKMEIAADDQ